MSTPDDEEIAVTLEMIEAAGAERFCQKSCTFACDECVVSIYIAMERARRRGLKQRRG